MSVTMRSPSTWNRINPAVPHVMLLLSWNKNKCYDFLQQSKEDTTVDQPHEKYPPSKSF